MCLEFGMESLTHFTRRAMLSALCILSNLVWFEYGT